MAKMRIVLKQAVANLGEAGDQVNVSGGFARNFLIPRGFAVPATKGNVKQADTWRNSRSARDGCGSDAARPLRERQPPVW